MDTAGTILVAILTLSGLISAGLCVLYAGSRRSVLRYLCMTVSAFLMEYLVAAGLLFMLDKFSVLRTLILVLSVNLMLLAVLTVLSRKRGWKRMSLEWDLRKEIVPILLLLMGIILSYGNFSFFGMGQDQGVYQTKAINLMYGETKTKFVLDEYDRLETEEEKAQFKDAAIGNLIGLDNINRNQAYYGLEPLDEKDNASYTHGIPTFSAVLALFGLLFGPGNMTHLSTVLYLLAALVIWYTAQNLRLKPGVAAFISLIFLLSPQVVWLSKSTATEIFLALIIAMQLCLLTNEDRKDLRWLSSLMVPVYGFLHLTIYVMIPMFALLYLLLYLYKGDRQYLKALIISAAGYMLGIQLAFSVNRYYTYGNTKILFAGPINIGNIHAVLLGIGALLLAAAAVLLLLKKPGAFFAGLLDSRGFDWFFRILVLGFLIYNAVQVLRLMGNDPQNAVVHNGLYDLLWMTGIIPLPVTLICMIIKPRSVLKTELHMGISLMFVYAILFRITVLQSVVYDCYYFGRYFGALLPYVCVMTGLVWNRFSARTVGAGILAGALVSLPFDGTLMLSKDDSKSSYNILERMAETVRSDRSTAVVFLQGRTSLIYYLPVRAMTQADCYFSRENLAEQIAWLGERYDRVLYLTDEGGLPQNLLGTADILLRAREEICEDDLVSNRIPWIPFPYGFTREEGEYTLMCFTDEYAWGADQLCTQGGEYRDGKIILPPEALQYGPFVDLMAGRYTVRVSGKNLQGASVIVSTDNGYKRVEFQNLATGENEISYTFDLDAPKDNVEMLVVNSTGGTMEVDGIRLRKKPFLPPE